MIRKYKDEDLNAILEIWYKSSTMAHPFLEDEFVKKVKKAMKEVYIPNSETWVYEKDIEPVGFISMVENEIGGLFVLPGFQSKGIGSKLINHIAPKFKTLEVEVFEKNEIGRYFYYKYGFKFLKKYHHNESDQIVLRLHYNLKKKDI